MGEFEKEGGIKVKSRVWVLVAMGVMGAASGFCGEGFKEISRDIYEVEGYEINVAGHQTGDILHVRGRVTWGEPCARLGVKMTFQNRAGDTLAVKTTVADAGGSGSRLIREDKPLRESGVVPETWDLTAITVKCARR